VSFTGDAEQPMTYTASIKGNGPLAAL